MALNLQNAFGLPLRAQALRLIGFARRAIALASVEAIVGVALFAVRLLGVHVANRSGIALVIFGRRNGVEMLGIHAGSISTGVVHDVAIRDGLVSQPHGQPVSLAVCSAESDHAVPVLVFSASPQNAVSGWRAL